ncbi:MAG TPA: serpin family protein [Micromonosporaceae bacterium]|nr:serpin family protein [Micromonosporaceae bacterium]
MAAITDLPVAAINAMTARWIAAFGGHPTVCAGVGAWPLLAILADVADGKAREELAAAVGIDPATGTVAGRALIDVLDEADGMSAALGLWSRHDVPLRSEWLAALPDGVHRDFTGDTRADQGALDSWADEHTDGLIKKMPVQIDESIALLLASALTVRTKWRQPFEKPRSRAGGWPLLSRTTDGVSAVRATTTATCVRIEGDNGIDVELVIGPAGMAASDVLSEGLAIVTGAREATDGEHFPDGLPVPGVVVDRVAHTSSTPQLVVDAPKFTVRASHDLLAFPEVFGLNAARRGHPFPGISDRALEVSDAKQDAMAEFTETGFRAAAITAVAMRLTMVRRMDEYDVRRVTVTFDRPYGFLAVHRDTGLILVAGWVTAPDAD